MNDDIGYCESCGSLDHHRTNGLCACCLNKVTTLSNKETEPPIGYEAAETTILKHFMSGAQHASRD